MGQYRLGVPYAALHCLVMRHRHRPRYRRGLAQPCVSMPPRLINGLAWPCFPTSRHHWPGPLRRNSWICPLLHLSRSTSNPVSCCWPGLEAPSLFLGDVLPRRFIADLALRPLRAPHLMDSLACPYVPCFIVTGLTWPCTPSEASSLDPCAIPYDIVTCNPAGNASTLLRLSA